MLLTVEGIECRYADHPVVRDLSFTLEAGDIACLLGPSGCGKTTVLRSIAGFEPIHAGQISVNGEIYSRTGYTRPPEHRGLGMVFQDYALFPHLTVADNLCFGLKKLSRQEKTHTTQRLLKLVGLQGLDNRYPHELSGGQQQRIALARALAPHPSLILLDEPFSNLDVDLRERLSKEVRAILKEAGASAILVTHDQHEAFAMGDCVGVMHEGRILQCDTSYNLYHEPENRFVADFIGKGVFLDGQVTDDAHINTEVGLLKCRHHRPEAAGSKVEVLMRPDDVIAAELADGQCGPTEPAITAMVEERAFMGAEILYTLRLPTGGKLLSLFPSHLNHDIGTPVGINIHADHVVAFPKH